MSTNGEQRAALDASLAEYVALRAEIEWAVREASQYQNFGMALIGATVAAVGLAGQVEGYVFLLPLLGAPLLFALLGVLSFRQFEEILLVAAYISTELRQHVQTLTKDPGVWGWEHFKRKNVRGEMSGLILRECVFLVPASVTVIAAVATMSAVGSEAIRASIGTTGLWSAIAAIVLDFGAIVTLVLTTVSRGRKAIEKLPTESA